MSMKIINKISSTEFILRNRAGARERNWIQTEFRNSVQQRVLIKESKVPWEFREAGLTIYAYIYTNIFILALTLKIVATEFYLRAGLCTFNSFLMPRTSGYSRALAKLSQCAEHRLEKWSLDMERPISSEIGNLIR